jgi:CheY-like chemotaxis protein
MNKRVIIFDANEIHSDLLKEALELEGMQVFKVINEEEAIVLLEKEKNIHQIIFDPMVNTNFLKKDNFQLFEKIKTRTRKPATKIVLHTTAEERELRNFGFPTVLYFQKPTCPFKIAAEIMN